MTNKFKKLYDLYPVLKSISKNDLDRALANCKVVVLKTGSVVFEEMQGCYAFPFILSGKLRVVKRAENGREILLYNVTAGDACVVTSGCLLGNKPYNAVGIVQEECELVMLPLDDFNNLLAINSFREFIFSLFSERVLGLMQLVDEVAFQKLDIRLARYLLERAPIIKLSHQELADELGTVREMVSRILNDFSERNLVKLSRGNIQIIDQKKLKDLCVT